MEWIYSFNLLDWLEKPAVPIYVFSIFACFGFVAIYFIFNATKWRNRYQRNNESHEAAILDLRNSYDKLKENRDDLYKLINNEREEHKKRLVELHTLIDHQIEEIKRLEGEREAAINIKNGVCLKRENIKKELLQEVYMEISDEIIDHIALKKFCIEQAIKLSPDYTQFSSFYELIESKLTK